MCRIKKKVQEISRSFLNLNERSELMNRNILTKISLTLSLVALVGVQSSYGIDNDTKEKIRLKAINTVKYALPSDGQVQAGGFMGADRTQGSYIGATSSSSSLGCTPGIEDAVRGLTIGCTFYDYQRNGSMNRLIATSEPDHGLNFTWMNQDNNSATGGRNVKYEGYDPITGGLTDGTGGVDIGGDLIPPNRSGYTSIASRGATGLVVNAHHWDPALELAEGSILGLSITSLQYWLTLLV